MTAFLNLKLGYQTVRNLLEVGGGGHILKGRFLRSTMSEKIPE